MLDDKLIEVNKLLQIIATGITTGKQEFITHDSKPICHACLVTMSLNIADIRHALYNLK